MTTSSNTASSQVITEYGKQNIFGRETQPQLVKKVILMTAPLLLPCRQPNAALAPRCEATTRREAQGEEAWKTRKHCVQLSSLPLPQWQPALLPRQPWQNSIKSAFFRVRSNNAPRTVRYGYASQALLMARMPVVMPRRAALAPKCNSKPRGICNRFLRGLKYSTVIKSEKMVAGPGS
jgi:hypothetical protein